MAVKDPRSPSNEPGGAGQGRPAKADWRRAASPAAPAPAVGKKAGGGWRERPDRAYEDARRWYRIRIASWIFFVVALFVTFIVVIIYWPQRTPLVAVAVTDYESLSSRAVPPNAWAKEDVEGFHDLDVREQIVEYASPPYISAKSGESAFEGLREEIRNRSKWWNIRRYPIIVYLSVHGVVNQDGKPCLLLPGDSPLASDKWVPLEKLVEYLFPADAQRALPAKKLLILDCNRMDVNYRLGLLYNSFADGLNDIVKNHPGLAILNSTSPGQIGWTSPEQLHGSVFAFFVWQGLRGTGDRSDEGGNHNGDVSLRELHGYIAKRVRQWVLEHRADIQEPKLFTEENDFFLVHAKSSPPTEIPAEKFNSRARWTADIDPLWSQHERLRASSPWRINPLGWEEFQQGLLRLEQLAVAGPSYDEEYVRLKEELSAKVKSLSDQGLPKDLSVASIPLRLRLAPDADFRKAEEEQKTLRAQWNPTEQRFAAETTRNVSYLAASAEIWHQCVQGLDSARWPDLLQFVDIPGRPGRPPSDLVEVHFLRMMSAHMDPVTLKDHRVAADRALAARDLAEKAAAPDDERVHYWIQSAVDKADDGRRRAEDRLFVGSAESAREAERALEALASPDRQTGAYPKAIRDADKVAKAFALRDRAWAEIPYYARWLLARQRPENKPQVQLLVSLIQNTHALGAELDRAILRRDWSPAWESSFQAAEADRATLEKEFQEECARLWERAPLNRETQQAISVVLSVPLVSGKQRSGLWVNFWEIAGGKRPGGEGSRAPADKSDEKGKAAEAAKTEPKSEVFRVGGLSDQDATAAYLKRLPPSHPVLAVLARSRLGVEDPPCLKLATNAAPARAASDEVVSQLARLAQQGQCVREMVALGNESVAKQCAAWLKESESRLDAGDRSPGECREGRAKADRLLRAAAPLMDLGRSPWEKPESDPPHQLRRLDLHYLLLWQAYRTLEDFWGPPPHAETANSPTPRSFFDSAAEQYLSSATALVPSVKRPRYDSPELKEAVNLRDRLEGRRKVAAKVVEPKPTDLSIKKADAGASKAQTATTPGEIGAEIAENLPEGTAAIYIRDPATSQPSEQTIPMLIQGEQGRTEFRRIGVSVKPGERALAQRYSVRSDDPRLQHARLDAVGLFRGHEHPTPFSATPPDYELTYTPPKYPPPVVTVFGEAGEPCPVMFVFDCSASMEANTTGIRELRRKKLAAGEAQPAGVTKRTRFSVALGALKQILERLAKSEVPYEVGLIAYGHRVGWGALDPETRKYKLNIWDPKNPGKEIPKPADNPLVPAEDVEVLRSPSPFGPAEWGDLEKQLDALHPLGETPLYLAIQTAITELQNKPPSKELGRAARRHILVITDGMNEVSGEGKRVLPDDLSQLLKNPENSDIVLDIVGFNLGDWDLVWGCVDRDEKRKVELAKRLAPLEEQGVDATAAAANDPSISNLLEGFKSNRSELKRLAAATKHAEAESAPGKDAGASKGFFEVDEDTGISKVVEKLRESLQLRVAKYAVERLPDAVPVGTAEVGQHVEIEKHVGVRQYAVKLGVGDRRNSFSPEPTATAGVSTELTLEGGEYEMLYLSKDKARLEHRRYDKNLRVGRDNVPDPADPENAAKRFFVGAHIPDWTGSKVQFEISIQNNDAAKFSPRPEEAWINVRPLVPEGTAAPAPYVVYDLTYVPRVPVPVLTFTAPDWPAKAEEAEIQLWFKLKKTPPDPQQVITVNDLRKRGGLQLQDVPTATFTVDTRPGEQGAPFQVVVSERYAPGKPILGVRVEIDPMPERISRQYNQKAGAVLHTFYYEPAVAPQAGTFRILLTPHSRLAERAVTLPSPLKIGIARRSR